MKLRPLKCKKGDVPWYNEETIQIIERPRSCVANPNPVGTATRKQMGLQPAARVWNALNG